MDDKRSLVLLITVWTKGLYGACGYSGIVCTCVTTIMIALAAIVAHDGITVRFLLSLLSARSEFRSAENGAWRVL